MCLILKLQKKPQNKYKTPPQNQTSRTKRPPKPITFGLWGETMQPYLKEYQAQKSNVNAKICANFTVVCMKDCYSPAANTHKLCIL